MAHGKGRIGSSLESFLKEEGRLEESTSSAIKRLQSRVIGHDTLKADMQAIARGEKPAPPDAGQVSFNSDEALKAAAEKGFASGISDRSLDEILDDARSRAQKAPKPHDRDRPA